MNNNLPKNETIPTIDQISEIENQPTESIAILPCNVSNYASRNVTRLENVTSPCEFTQTPLSVALAEIGSERHKNTIERMRVFYSQSIDESISEYDQKAALAVYRESKKNLPAFSFNGTFLRKVSNDSFAEASGVMIIDLDKLSAAGLCVASVKQKLAADPATVAVFVSPSGDGLKVLFASRLVSNDAAFKILFAQVAAYVKHTFGLDVDVSGKDIRRVCFASYDPNIYVNYDAEIVDLRAYEMVIESTVSKYTGSETTRTEPLAKIQAALDSLPASIIDSRETWFKVGCALHHEFSGDEDGFTLFDVWSKKSDNYGETRETWESLKGRPNSITIATLYALAREHGWDGSFVENSPVGTVANFVDFMQSLVLTEEEAEAIANPEWIIMNLVILGHLIVIPAKPNGGKTTIFFFLAGEMVKKGFRVFYVNADIAGVDAKTMRQDADNMGVTLVLPDLKGSSMSEVVKMLDGLNSSGEDLSKFVFIFDTLKKMTDVIEKKKSKNLLSLLRSLTAKGATIILLAHTNKYDDKDGNPIFEGTGDLRADVDEMIFLMPLKHPDGSMDVMTKPDKVRGNFEPMAFKISPERKVSIVDPEESRLDIQRMVEARLVEMDHDVIAAIKCAISSGDNMKTTITKYCKALAIGKRTVDDVLRRYANKFWKITPGLQNTHIYSLIE